MKKHILLFTTLLLFFAGCKNESKNKFSIEGKIDRGAGKMMYIEELTPDGPHFLDSIKLDKKGEFVYKGAYAYQTFYNLHVSDVDYVVLLPFKHEKIRITGVYDSLSLTYRVEGSKESIALWQLQDYSNDGRYKLLHILSIDAGNRGRFNIRRVGEGDSIRIDGDTAAYRQAKKVTDSLYLEAYDEQAMYVTKFIEDNSGSLAALIALYKPFNGDRPLIDVDRYPELFTYYEQVLQGLEENEATANNPHTIAFKNVVERLRFRIERRKLQAVNFSLNGAE